MIITKVFGGLGNQMFQYATGRALSHRLGVAMQVDTRSLHLEGASHNGYELSRVFNIDSDRATDAGVRRMLGWRSSRIVQRLLRKLPTHGGSYIFEPHFHYWPGLDRITPPCYIDGYWQSFRYFSTEAALIASDFTFRLELQGDNDRVSRMIDEHPQSASIHVRRGDYVSHPSAAKHHGTCGVEYYREAMAYLSTRSAKPIRYFIFSDDLEWARENLALPSDAVFVQHNRGTDSHFDLQLMARCRHNILANSSFSWWAAWLNRNNEKMVVAPRRWFLADYDTSALTPPDWVRL